MKDLLTYLAKSLVDNPDKIEITEENNQEGFVSYSIKAESTDIGKLIGKEGKIIHALRLLMHTRAVKENKKVMLRISE